MQEIKQAINDGALFVINHSGGKDSQAMMISLVNQVPREQLLVVHSTLGQHEWPGAMEHAQQQASDAKVEFRVAQAGKSFFDMVDRRFISRPEVPCWPGDATRQCTSDLKRDPVKKVIRNYAKEFSHTRIINCMGLRAQESAKRAKKPCYACDKKMSVAGRLVHDYLPIHKLSTEQVLQTISDAGQRLHYAYTVHGNDRLSCIFCFYASKQDLCNGARLFPELYAQYCWREVQTGYTFHISMRSLPDITGIQPAVWR